MPVYQYSPDRPWQASRIFRELRADVYHSQDTSLGTALAHVAMPSAAHVVTFRDPMDRVEWQVESAYADMPRLGWALYRQFITNPFVAMAVRRAEGLYCAAEFLIPKATELYRLPRPPRFLPSPVDLPPATPKAASAHRLLRRPLGGTEARRAVLRARTAVPRRRVRGRRGGARSGARPCPARALRRDRESQDDRRARPVRDTGMGRGARAAAGFSSTTSAREGLPTAFIEAAAHRCAILSFTGSRRIRNPVRQPGDRRTARAGPARPAARRPVARPRRSRPAACRAGLLDRARRWTSTSVPMRTR